MGSQLGEHLGRCTADSSRCPGDNHSQAVEPEFRQHMHSLDEGRGEMYRDFSALRLFERT
jgi:hypothetical protein